ncbi:PAS domain-containing protein [Lacibacterium aquatile]|uniref:PAS domain-containing protein n=1 Tax=Lacibacterium aquatile TaxID=1168082 RepID=A0ABW5DQU3_9PROT
MLAKQVTAEVGVAYPRSTDPLVIAGRAAPQTLALIDLWHELRGNDTIPDRRRLDPAVLKPWINNLGQVEVSYEPELTLTYRLMAERLISLRGKNPVGRTVGEGYYGRSLEEVFTNYTTVIGARRPMLDWEEAQSCDGKYLEIETLFLPFSRGGDSVQTILLYVHLIVNATGQPV